MSRNFIKKKELFSEKEKKGTDRQPANVFGTANDIVIAGFSDLGRDYDATLDKMLRR